MEEKKLTDEEIIHDLEKFASDSDMNETGIYAEILDLIHRLQNKIKEQDKEYIELDLECRELRTNLDKELAEHEEFTKKAKEEIERLKIDIKNEKNWGKIQTKQAVKDTAKEMISFVEEKDKKAGKYSIYRTLLQELKERYEVE